MEHEQLFDEICHQHLGLVARIAHAFALERTDREDLFQEILVAVWQTLPRFHGESQIIQVYRIALACALSWKSSRRRFRHKIAVFLRSLPHLTEPGDPGLGEKLRWLYRKILQLAPVDRALMILRLDQVSDEAIAAITGLSASNVAVRLCRAEQQLTQSEEVDAENGSDRASSRISHIMPLSWKTSPSW